MTHGTLPRILCVDDEPNVLESLGRNLRRSFTVFKANGGAQALELLAHSGPFAAVVSDLSMPFMDGTTLLRRIRGECPDTIRILLTGHSDIDAAIAAVNEGAIFRFLRKPCPPEELTRTLEAAAKQYKLITAERVLLEQTLHGSIKTLTDVLSLVNPMAFGRANRVKAEVSAVAKRMQVSDLWQIEVAAMLSQIGAVTLPAEITEKIYRRQPLTPAQQAMADRLPLVSEQLIANIPRLEPVREILKYQDKHFDGSGLPADRIRGAEIPLGARLLKVVLDFDALETDLGSSRLALETMHGRHGWYDGEVVRAFDAVHGGRDARPRVHELALEELVEGMIFVEDLVSLSGIVLVARGQEVTRSLLERIHNFAQNTGVQEPLRVVLPTPAPACADEAVRATTRSA
jgi:response regulator RpfG family c-di-GMP phosphodiesterase